MPYADHEHLHQYGLSLEVSLDGTTWTFIDDLFEADAYESEWGKSDDFTLQSPNRVKLTTPGWQTLSDIPIQSYLHKTQFETLLGYFHTRKPLQWRLTLPKLSSEATATTGAFFGYISKFKHHQQQTAGGEEKLKVAWTITPTTQIVSTPGT